MTNQSKNPRFQLSRTKGSPVNEKDLIPDLKRVAGLLGVATVTQNGYGTHGMYDCSTIIRRFGSWNEALRAAGLFISNEVGISDQRLFENLLLLWQHYGRQPRRAELAHEPSTISQSPYKRRFRTWTAALQAFVDYANSSGLEKSESPPQHPNPGKESYGECREPSLRLRWHVLQRDRFVCCGCGATPALTPGVELHVDHVRPWSRGGATTLDNLQTLCAACNLGKSDVVLSQPADGTTRSRLS